MIAFCVHLKDPNHQYLIVWRRNIQTATDHPSPESQVELVPPAQTADPVVPSPSYISQSTSDVGKRSLDQSFSTTDVRHGS